MPSCVRPKGSGGGTRAPSATPMSERQQMALLMQMTSSGESGSRSPSSGSRTRDRNERGETPLHLAAIKGDVEQVCRLLAHRTDPNVTDFAGWTPFHEACNYGWYEVAFRLIQAGANVNAKGLDNDTPLHDAVANGHVKIVKLLVEKGADINAKNSKGKTPVDIASPAIQQYLLNPSLPLPESSSSLRTQPRTRDDKKVTATTSTSSDSKQKSGGSSTTATSSDAMDTKSNAGSANADDIYEFKSVKETDSSPEKGCEGSELDTDASDPLSINMNTSVDESSSKRPYSEFECGEESTTNEDETKRKKRKEDNSKESSKATQRGSGQAKGQGGKQSAGGQGKASGSGAKNSSSSNSGDKKSPCTSPKPTTGTNSSSDAEVEGSSSGDGKTADLKVPPLKIVIPQSSSEQDTGTSRNGKNSSQRAHQALPYVVASSSNDSADKELSATTASPENAGNNKDADKKDSNANQSDDQRSGSGHQRVLRSSHRGGGGGGGGGAATADRNSNSSSPQPHRRSHSPSPSSSSSSSSSSSASPVAASNQADIPTSTGAATYPTSSKTSDSQATQNAEIESSTSSSASTSASSAPASVDLHPRKRKMKQNKEQSNNQQQQQNSENPESASESREVHPHEQPITNCYKLFMNIRKQIEKRRKGLFPVQPKPPQGFKDYLMNRCTYVLAGTASTSPNITYPPSLPQQMKDLFTEQEKERYRLRMQHVIEKEKLVLSVEQEILRVHGRAARALANQSLPFSVCTILRDEEVYNLITPEQEEKDRNARSRYNGRLFLSWLQDVDDKWEKIKEHMLLRHHNEAESLHAVQKMNWEWKMKEHNLCDRKTTPKIDDLHVPMVHVSDDFDLLPA